MIKFDAIVRGIPLLPLSSAFRVTRTFFGNEGSTPYSWLSTDDRSLTAIMKDLEALGLDVEAVSGGSNFSSEFEAGLDKLEDSGAARIGQDLRSIKRIYSLVMNITNACDGGCNICLAFVDPNKSLDLPDIKRIVDLIAAHDVKRIAFTGGEPLLYPHIFGILQYAHGLGLATALTTNGTVLTDETIESLNGITDEIAIPYSSTDPKIAMQMTPYATQAHLARMEEVFKKIIGTTSIKLIVVSVLSKTNSHEILTVGEKLVSLDIPIIWKLDQYYETERNKKYHSEFYLEEQEFDRLQNEITIRFSGRKIKIIWQPAGPRIQNKIFFISPAGRAVTNYGNLNRVAGEILDPKVYAPLFAETESITPTRNYRHGEEPLDSSSPQYDTRHLLTYYGPMAESIRSAGAMALFSPHVDYGANLLVPPYVRRAIYDHFSQFLSSIPEDDFHVVDPILYSAGLGTLGKHPSDRTFYEFESFWKWAPKTRITVKGPFVGRTCIYYLLCPSAEDYFTKLRGGLGNIGIRLQQGKETSHGIGWINVARTRTAVPYSKFALLQQIFRSANSSPLTSFVPIEAGPLKSNWIGPPTDGQVVRNMTAALY